MSDFPAQVHALSAAARELRLSLLDNQAKVSWIDASSQTHLLEGWKGLREEYRKMLDESESAATRLATAMNTYVGLQEYMDDPSMLDDLVEEFEGLNETLKNMSFGQDDDFSRLKKSFERLGQDIDLLLKAHSAPPEDQVSASRDALTRSPQEPAMQVIASQYLTRFVWGRSDHINRANSAPMRPTTTSVLPNAKSTGFTGIRAMPAVLQLMENNLETQKSLSRVVLVDMKDKLVHEIQTYLTALRNAQSSASPENQLALRNATRRVTSSTESWRERSKALTDGYAKSPK